MLLPLDSPLWQDLTACSDRRKAHTLLCRIVETGRLGQAWDELRDELVHQGTVYDMTSAALPHLIRLGPSLPLDEQRELWTDLAYLVLNGAGSWSGREPFPGMQETLTRSIGDAEVAALQAFLADDAETGPAEAGYHALACVALARHPVGDVLETFLHPDEGYVSLECPECGNEVEADGFGDPIRPPCAAPPVPRLEARDRPEWTGVPTDLPPGFEGFALSARAVADAGLPRHAPATAVWCLVAAMVAAKGAASWARTLLRLTGDFHCGVCDEVWPVATGLGAAGLPREQPREPAVVAGPAGFRPAPGGSTVPGDFTLEPVPVPDGLRPASSDEVLVTMPDGRGGARVPWLAELRDGRTLLATATDSVHLRDPLTREALGELWRREGKPVAGMAFHDDLVVVYGDLTVDVWSPKAVTGERSTMAPKPESLAAQGHDAIVAVCGGAGLGYRKPIVLADRNGTVSVWETFGVRLTDPLPPDPGHRDVFTVAACGGLVVTAGGTDANIRIWQPHSGKVSLVRLESAPRWATFAGDVLVVGLDGGPVSFSVR